MFSQRKLHFVVFCHWSWWKRTLKVIRICYKTWQSEHPAGGRGILNFSGPCRGCAEKTLITLRVSDFMMCFCEGRHEPTNYQWNSHECAVCRPPVDFMCCFAALSAFSVGSVVWWKEYQAVGVVSRSISCLEVAVVLSSPSRYLTVNSSPTRNRHGKRADSRPGLTS